MIRNLADLAEMLCAEPTEASVARNVYKYTECGAWISFTPTGIRLGSIVEGADCGTAIYPLDYPFTEADYRAREAAIEKEADAIWRWANEEQDADIDFPDVSMEFEHLGPDGRSS